MQDHPDVLGSRDLARPVHGTWLGINRHGRIAVLTNFREKNLKNVRSIVGRISRGEIVGRFLTLPATASTADYAKELLDDEGSLLGSEAGGFSLAFGDVREPLSVVSNRPSGYESDNIPGETHTDQKQAITNSIKERYRQTIGAEGSETVALSNIAFGDQSWPKVALGEELMKSAIEESVASSESADALIARLTDILSHDTLPRLPDASGLEDYLGVLKESIFIPAIGVTTSRNNKENEQMLSAGSLDGAAPSNDAACAATPQSGGSPLYYCRGSYGTQTQTVVLVHKSGRVTYFERTLYDQDANAIPEERRDQVFRFDLDF
ncbi:hypothetical protein KEM52_005085 [Ascosphaera acerosa]|nr:hypothetical protein KEM52_005085 [Ascosphaera acerosa]